MAGQVRLALGVADDRPVGLPVREVLEDRRHRVVLGVLGQPDPRGEARAVGEVEPGVLDLPDAARESVGPRHYVVTADSSTSRSRLYGSGIAGFSESISRASRCPSKIASAMIRGATQSRSGRRLDPLVRERLLAGLELAVELVVGEALGDEDDGVRLELERLAELVRALTRPGSIPSASSPCACGCRVVQVLAEQRPFEVSSQTGATRSCGVTSSTETLPASFSASPAAMK